MTDKIPQDSPMVIEGLTPNRFRVDGTKIDGRSGEYKRHKELCERFARDLNVQLSTAQWVLIHRAASLTTQAEMMDAAMMQGDCIDERTYTNLSRTILAILKELGIQRNPLDITPDTEQSGNPIDAFFGGSND